MPDGTVCELPIGLRDGLGKSGPFDEQILLDQMVHQHRIVGGFAARIPPSIGARYRETPVLRSLFSLSDGQPIDPRDATLTPAQAGAALRSSGLTYIVVNRTTAPAPLIDYVETGLPVALIEQDATRTLYQISNN
jgi:hypothetical protein